MIYFFYELDEKPFERPILFYFDKTNTFELIEALTLYVDARYSGKLEERSIMLNQDNTKVSFSFTTIGITDKIGRRVNIGHIPFFRDWEPDVFSFIKPNTGE